GTRTHDLLHGNRVVGSVHLSCFDRMVTRNLALRRVSHLRLTEAISRRFRRVWAANAACCPNAVGQPAPRRSFIAGARYGPISDRSVDVESLAVLERRADFSRRLA